MALVFIGGYCKVADYGGLLSQKRGNENRAVWLPIGAVIRYISKNDSAYKCNQLYKYLVFN